MADADDIEVEVGSASEGEAQERDSALIEQISLTANKSIYNNAKASKRALSRRSQSEMAPANAADVGGAESARPAGARAKTKGGGFFVCCGGRADVEGDGAAVVRDPKKDVSYSVVNAIGEGGFSRVMLVRAKSGHIDVQADKPLAMKVIPKSHLRQAGDAFMAATMLEREILANQSNPFLVRLYHSFQERDRLVLVMEYYPAGSLHMHVNVALKERQRGEQRTGFGEARARFYTAEVASAIAHLHANAVVHRDLKLENVLMAGSGHVAVSDFGAAKQLRREPSGALGTTTTVVGTPAYMAPEILLNVPYGVGCDWWALGVMLFTMLEGRLPFDAPNEAKMLWRIVKAKPHYPEGVHESTAALLRALLQKRPETRLASFDTLRTHAFFASIDWDDLAALRVPPPFVPTLDDDDDMRYVPDRVSETGAALPATPYKKGDSMRKLFRNFSHRGSFGAGAATPKGTGGEPDGAFDEPAPTPGAPV